MIEYRITKANDKILPEMGKDNRQLITILDDKFYFSRQIKQTREVKIDKPSKEWEEFIKAYRELNNNGSYDKRLIKKYHECIKETPHKEIMENLGQYKIYLEVKNKQKYALQVGTYLNKASYKNTWEIVKDQSKKFINNIFVELKLTAVEIENAKTEIDARETKNKPKEITDFTVRSIINYIKTGKPL